MWLYDWLTRLDRRFLLAKPVVFSHVVISSFRVRGPTQTPFRVSFRIVSGVAPWKHNVIKVLKRLTFIILRHLIAAVRSEPCPIAWTAVRGVLERHKHKYAEKLRHPCWKQGRVGKKGGTWAMQWRWGRAADARLCIWYKTHQQSFRAVHS